MHNVEAVQRRTLRLLFAAQVAGGVGVAIGVSVGALLAADLVSVGVSGLAQSAAVLGAALIAIPATRIARRFGRGPSLASTYVVAALGAVLAVAATMLRNIPLIIGGVAMLLGACAVAGTAGHDTGRLAIGLVLLGLGWSATMVAGSALLSASIAAEIKPSAQGLSDLVMGLAGASAGALSGVVVQAFDYPILTLVAALMAVPLAFLAGRERQRATA